ncbi:hypothetical protein Ccar_16765 [Clostridium carboxidivorans P7]|uniref:hypothetical protein n=1 Tax=Clostridium carboxidivorans TaxID=217159 RepID=UPI00064ED8F6|nr:hypothetical protein [Clostridium carboxidivorans]AKN32419.1 hypothetical protein Ccar_16765 [Clostridium carboxidivorans P7]
MSETKKEVAQEVPVQEQPQNDELTSALSRVINVLEYENQSSKNVNKCFEKTALLNKGTVSIKIDLHNIPSKELLNALDKLQELSNTLMFEEIPDSITAKLQITRLV